MDQLALAIFFVGPAFLGLGAGYWAGRRRWTLALVALLYPAANAVLWIRALTGGAESSGYEWAGAMFGWTVLTVPVWLFSVAIGAGLRRGPREPRPRTSRATRPRPRETRRP